MKKNLAIIPARANSQRIPKKNFKVLGNKPLIDYTIDACLNSGVIDSILITSDSEEILSHAEKRGLLTHIRPKELAEEKTNTELEATRWVVLNYVREDLKLNFDKYLFLLPTYPFRSEKDVQKAIAALNHSNFIISIENLSKHNLEAQQPNGRRKALEFTDDEKLVRWNSFMNGSRIERDPKLQKYTFVEVNRIQNIDIDTDLDWIQAEYIIKNNFFNFENGQITYPKFL